MKFVSFILVCVMMTGCASINSVSLTSIPAQRKNEVKAEASRVIILGFNFDNDYVDELSSKLKQQCPNGKVSGILTKDETILYFLFFVFKKRVTAEGYCLDNAVTQNKKRTRGTASEEKTETPAEQEL